MNEECRFLKLECDEKCTMIECVDPMLRLKYCQCCLMGKLIRELQLIRATG